MNTKNCNSKWDAKAREFRTYSETPIGRVRFLLISETLESHLPPAPLNVLEVGCGLGQLACFLAERGDTVTAVDYAPTMLRLAADRAATLSLQTRTRLDLRQIDIAALPEHFSPASFDLLAAHTVLDYLPEPKVILSRLRELLKPGGILSLASIGMTAS